MGLHSELNPSSRGFKASPHSGKVISISVTFIKWCIWGLVSSLNNLNNVIFVQLWFTKQSQKEYVSKLFPESCENNKQPIFKIWKAHVWKKQSHVKPRTSLTNPRSKNLWILHQATASTCWRHDLSSTTMDGISMQGHIHQVEANASILDDSSSYGDFVRRLPSRRCSFLTVSAAWNIISFFSFLRRIFPCL